MTGAAPPAGSAAEQNRLAAIAAYAIIGAEADDPVRADLRALCELAATMCGAPSAVVNLIDDRMQHQVAAYGVDPAPCRRDEAMCQTTLAGGADVCLLDASADARFAASPWVDGRLGHIRFYCSTILRTPAGHAIGTLCVFDDQPRELSDQQFRSVQVLAAQVVDVLELRLRTRELEHTVDELTRAQDRLASFAGQISHDLKAPITAIIGFTELLTDLEAITDDPSAGAYVGRCASAARRMLAMIDDLLAFARVGATLSRRPIALDDVMPEVLDDLGARDSDAQISWSGPDVIADRSQLRALLRNVIGNSLVYRGEQPAVVEVLTEQVGGDIVVRVNDNGPGIPAESREDVLRPLMRLRRDIPGAGLGLAVCVRVMASHGGTLRLDGAPGGGTSVIAAFPREAAPASR